MNQSAYWKLIYIYVPFSFLQVSNTVIAKNTVFPAIDSNNACDFTTLEFELIWMLTVFSLAQVDFNRKS